MKKNAFFWLMPLFLCCQHAYSMEEVADNDFTEWGDSAFVSQLAPECSTVRHMRDFMNPNGERGQHVVTLEGALAARANADRVRFEKQLREEFNDEKPEWDENKRLEYGALSSEVVGFKKELSTVKRELLLKEQGVQAARKAAEPFNAEPTQPTYEVVKKALEEKEEALQGMQQREAKLIIDLAEANGAFHVLSQEWDEHRGQVKAFTNLCRQRDNASLKHDFMIHLRENCLKIAHLVEMRPGDFLLPDVNHGYK